MRAKGARGGAAAGLVASSLVAVAVALLLAPTPRADLEHSAAAAELAASEAIAVAGSIVRVKAGTAVFDLACHNHRCKGTAELVAQLPRDGRTPREVLIGRAAFAIPAETRIRFRIRLNEAGRKLTRRVKKSGRYVLFTGEGVRSRTVLLKRVRRIPPP